MKHPLIEALIPAVRAAGDLIETIRIAGAVARDKADHSPVTEADEQAEILLAAAIRAIAPDAVIVGEEASAAGFQPEPSARFWLIDPLDGTKDFIRGGPDYSVNVALIEDGIPVLGLVLAPRDGTLWAGAAGLGAFKQLRGSARVAIRTRPLAHHPIIVTSRTHLDSETSRYAAAIPGADTRPSGSSLKFCLVAEGAADIYPRFGPTCEWDTAAGDALLRAAGGITRGKDGKPFAYAKPKFLNRAFLAVGDPDAVIPPL